MNELKVEANFREQAVDALQSRGSKLSWLARETGISASHLRNILKGDPTRYVITEVNKRKIADALNLKITEE